MGELSPPPLPSSLPVTALITGHNQEAQDRETIASSPAKSHPKSKVVEKVMEEEENEREEVDGGEGGGLGAGPVEAGGGGGGEAIEVGPGGGRGAVGTEAGGGGGGPKRSESSRDSPKVKLTRKSPYVMGPYAS